MKKRAKGNIILRFARELRNQPTQAEAIMWENLRNRKFQNLKMRRQHMIGNFIVDFYCHEYRLVIDIDGNVHDNPQQKAYDEERSMELRSMGYRVIRFQNDVVMGNLTFVLSTIMDFIKSLE